MPRSPRNLSPQRILLLTALIIGPVGAAAAADSPGVSRTIHLVGKVPARASVSLRPTKLHPSGNTFSLIGDTGILVRANHKAFTVSLLAPHADTAGQPRLRDPETGETLPYRLTYAGQELTFVDGQAVLGGPSGSLLAAAPAAGGRYEDQLVLVVKAR